MMIVEERYSFF